MSTSNRTRPKRGRMSTRILIGLLAGLVVLMGVGLANAAPARDPSIPANYPPDKAALLQREADELASRKVPGKPSLAEGHAMAMAAQSQVETFPRTVGIIEGMAQAPFPRSEFRVSNFYQGWGGGRWLLVYAGTALDASGTMRGSLRILSASDTGSITPVGTYDAPTPGTTLRLESYTGTSLTLTDDAGAKISFDLETLTYR